MSKRCASCGTANRDQAKHCIQCGAALLAEAVVPRLCPAGRHAMNPAWEVCPYCAVHPEDISPLASHPAGVPAAPPARGDTVLKTPPQSDPATVVEGAAALAAPREPVVPVTGRDRTKFMPSPTGDSSARELRRIVAVLVTYSWDATGQLFPLREGRNYIGRDSGCEVCLPADAQLSAKHAAITYRGDRFWIDDEGSMNGTTVDGALVEEKRELGRQAVIRTGSTVWRFVSFELPVNGQPFS